MENTAAITKQLVQLRSGSIASQDSKYLFDIKCLVDTQSKSSDTLAKPNLATAALPSNYLEANAKHIVQFAASSMSFDPETRKLYSGILALAVPKQSNIPQAKVFGLGEPFYISVENARLMLSQDEHGNTIKSNELGSSSVTSITINEKLNETTLYFKTTHSLLCGGFLIEQAVYQMSLLLGGGVIAPTRLLIIEMPNNKKHTVQVSLGIKGEHLKDIVNLATGLAMLESTLGSELFAEDFIALLEGKYYQEWLRKTGYEENKLTKEKLDEIFIKTITELPVRERPLEFQNITAAKIKQEVLGINLKKHEVLPMLAFMSFMKKYPNFSGSIHLADLLRLLGIFSTLKRIYPRWTENVISKKVPVKGLIDEVSGLMKCFKQENVVRHFLLALLTEPHDHKGDNLKVIIEQSQEEKVISLRIVGIDNDLAMMGAVDVRINSSKKLEYVVMVRTSLYCIEEFLEEEIPTVLQEFVLSIVPENFVNQWLGAMQDYVEEYRLLLTENFVHDRYLTDQLPYHFEKKLFERLELMISIIKMRKANETSPLILRNLLYSLEPLVSIYYSELGKLQTTATGLNKIIFSHDQPKLLEVLSGRLHDILPNGKTVQAMLQELTPKSPYLSYEETLKDHCLRYGVQSRRPNNSQEDVLTLLMKSQINSEKLQRLELILLLEVFVKLYAKHKQVFIQFIRQFKTVSFFVSENSSPFLFTDPNILFLAMSRTQNETTLLEGLLSFGVDREKAIQAGGVSPLHYAVQYCTIAIPILIESQFRFDLKDDIGRTPLDLAIALRNIPAVKALLLAGAGSFVELKGALEFIEGNSNTNPDLCQGLLKQNVELQWNLALIKVSQKEKTYQGNDKKMQAEEILLEGIDGLRYLTIEARKQIFQKGVAAGFPRENLYGRHNTVKLFCSIGNGMQVGIHLKEYPEFFGREVMVHHLAKHLFGFITPPVSLWRLNKLEGFWTKSKKGYPVLASRLIAGGTLRDAIDYHPHQLTQLDKQSVSEAIVLAMMINSEDGRADQYMLEPYSLGSVIKYRIVSIDNERAFVRPIALDANGREIAGPAGLQVKNILFCLDEMLEPLHERVIEKILAIDPYKLLTSWLEDLKKEQDTISGTKSPMKAALFNETERKDLAAIGVNLDLVFMPSLVIDIYQKLIRLQTALKRDPLVTGLDLLHAALPNLAIRYRKAFREQNTVDARFRLLTQDSFDVQEIKEPEYQLLLWPKSKINLHLPLNYKGNAIVLARQDSEIDHRIAYQAYCIRNGSWVTQVEKDVSLKTVKLTSKLSSYIKFNDDGLAIPDEKTKHELNMIIQEAIGLMRSVRHCHMTKTKPQSIHIMTGEVTTQSSKIKEEQITTPALAMERLKEVGDNQSKLKTIRDELQQGDKLQQAIRAFMTLPNDQKTIVLNGKQSLSMVGGADLEFEGIDFGQMKLPDSQPDLSRQAIILKLMFRLEFQNLQIRNCEILTNEDLGKILQSSPGLYTLSLIGCPKITDAAFKLVHAACPHIKGLELDNLKLKEIKESFEWLRVLRIKDCLFFESWGGECVRLDKLEIIGCPLFLSSVFYVNYPFLLSLSQFSILDTTNIHTLMQTILMENNLTIKLIPIEARQKIMMTLNLYFKANMLVLMSVKMPLHAWSAALKDKFSEKIAIKVLEGFGARLSEKKLSELIMNLFNALEDRDFEIRHAAVKTLDILSSVVAAKQLDGMIKSWLNTVKNKNFADVRIAAVKALDKQSSSMSELSLWHVSVELSNMLKDVNSEVRIVTATTLGGFKIKLPERVLVNVIEVWLNFLKDDNPYLRSTAVNAICDLAAKLSDLQLRVVIGPLLNAMKDKDPYVRGDAIKILDRMDVRLLDLLLSGMLDITEITVEDEDAGRPRAYTFLTPERVLLRKQAQMTKIYNKVIKVEVLDFIKNLQWRDKIAVIKPLIIVSSGYPITMLKKIVAALLGAFDSDDYQEMGFVDELNNLKVKLPEYQIEGLVQALLYAHEINDLNIKIMAAIILSNCSIVLSELQLQKVLGVLLSLIIIKKPFIIYAVTKILGNYSAALSDMQLTWVIDALIDILKDKAIEGRGFVAKTFGKFSTRLSVERFRKVAEGVVETLLFNLGDKSWNVREGAIESLGEFNAVLLEGKSWLVLKSLLASLRDKERYVREAAVKALANFNEKKANIHLNVIIEGFVHILKSNHLKYAKETALYGLRLFSVKLEGDLLQTTIEVFLSNLQDKDMIVSIAAVRALQTLSPKLLTEMQLIIVVETMLQFRTFMELKNGSGVNAEYILSNFSGRLSDKLLERMIAALLLDLKNENRTLTAVKILDNFGAKLPVAQLMAPIKILLDALNDKNLEVQGKVANVLGSFCLRLPVENWEEWIQRSLQILEGDSFVCNRFHFILTIVYIMGLQYFDKVVAKKIRQYLTINTKTSIIYPPTTQSQSFGQAILNAFDSFENYHNKFGIQMCDLIANYADPATTVFCESRAPLSNHSKTETSLNSDSACQFPFATISDKGTEDPYVLFSANGSYVNRMVANMATAAMTRTSIMIIENSNSMRRASSTYTDATKSDDDWKNSPIGH